MSLRASMAIRRPTFVGSARNWPFSKRADCSDVEVTDADRVAFVDALAERFVGFDHDAALGAARAAEPTLLATVVAVESAAPVSLSCPATELWQWYRLRCP